MIRPNGNDAPAKSGNIAPALLSEPAWQTGGGGRWSPRSLRSPFALAIASLSSFFSMPARADDHVSGLRSELLTERSHDIALTVHRDHAELVVPAHRPQWRQQERPGDVHDRRPARSGRDRASNARRASRAAAVVFGRAHGSGGRRAEVPRAHGDRRLLPEGSGAAFVALAGPPRASGVPLCGRSRKRRSSTRSSCRRTIATARFTSRFPRSERRSSRAHHGALGGAARRALRRRRAAATRPASRAGAPLDVALVPRSAPHRSAVSS